MAWKFQKYLSILCSSLLLMLSFSLSLAQPNQDTVLSEDSKAAIVYEGESLVAFAKKLTQHCTGEAQKATAIIEWIAQNVQYDCDAFKDPKASQREISYKNKQEYAKKAKAWELSQARKTLQTGRAICMGYTSLAKHLCIAVGLKAEIVKGYIKTGSGDINRKPGQSNHAWNAIQIKGEWQLFDPTLASGYVKQACSGFVPHFREGYLGAAPEQFIVSHFPEEQRWQLLEKPLSAKAFWAMPYIAFGYYKFGVFDFSPKGGKIFATSEGIPFEIEFLDAAIIRDVVIIEDERRLRPGMFWEGNTLSFQYTPASDTAKQLSIYFESDDKRYLAIKYILEKK